jgi:ABC-type Fe3+/spermidine/putrescine transport system ATPase subunit
MVAPLLEAESLRRSYGHRTVVDVDALALQPGETLAVVGPNGAGKSTLFRLLMLLEKPDAGVVRIAGRAAGTGDTASRRRLAGVFQRPILFSGSVRDNVGYGLRGRGLARDEQRQRVGEAIELLALQSLADAAVHTLSGGEAQRVALARALAIRPDVLLLDEPTANLDVIARRRFRHDLERAALQRAAGMILVTHDESEAFGLADRVAVMHHGRIVQTGTPDEIMASPGSPFVAELAGAELSLHGTVAAVEDGLATITLGHGLDVLAVGDARMRRGGAAVVAYRPEDVTLGPADDDHPTSAVNRLNVVVTALVPTGPFVRVRLRAEHAPAVRLSALVTRRSAEALALTPGARASAHMKATALRAWQTDTTEN